MCSRGSWDLLYQFGFQPEVEEIMPCVYRVVRSSGRCDEIKLWTNTLLLMWCFVV